MHLVSIRTHGSQGVRVGALVKIFEQGYVLDLNLADGDLPGEMTAFLRAGEGAMETARGLASVAAMDPEAALRLGTLLAAEDATLLAPVPRPGKIVCLGHNYYDHMGVGRAAPAEFPTIFGKTANTVTGPGMPIRIPPVTQQVDYEAELAVVIGKPAYRVQQEQALEYVAGYTIFNDVSARDYQKRTSQWMLGKCFDTFGPMGPALVTADEIPDPHDLELSLRLNGLELQHTSTKNMIYSIPYLIAYLSEVMTLEPGDLISTGTPAKTALAQTVPPFMKEGDEVKITITKIGELTNPVAAG